MTKSNLVNPLYKLPKSSSRLGGIMWGSVGIGVCLLVFASVIATQYLASTFAYQEALGSPILQVGEWRVYAPFIWILWMWKWRDLDNPVIHHSFTVVYLIVMSGSFIAVMTSFYMRYRRTRNFENDAENLYGSAHWATEDEIKATTLLPTIGQGKGVYVGAWKNPKTNTIHYLRHDGPEHIMAFAPTRSGKGVGLVLPTLLSWPHSAVIYDIKGENWAISAGWRQQEANNYVLKFEPTSMDGSSVCFNPLEEIRIGSGKEVSDVQNIATMIIDPDGKGLKDHWQKTGHALLVGSMLHVLYAEKDKTLAGIANFLSEPTRTIDQTLHYMLGTEHDPEGKQGWRDSEGNPTCTHPVIATSARDMLNKSEQELSGVLSTAMSFLSLYRDPVVANNTRVSQFKVRDLMNAEKPLSLYLVVPPSDKDRLKPLIRLILNQIMRSLLEEMKFQNGRSIAGYKHKLLLLIDEFPSLGRLEIFEESLAFIAGYGIKAYLIVQDISQLWAAYGRDESIFSNCHIRIAYAPNKIETARLLSEMTGTTTVIKAQNSYSGDRLTPMLSNVSTSQHEVSRALLTPDEVMRLPGAKKNVAGDILEAGDMLIFMAGHAPIYGKQILYFNDKTFITRAKVPTPASSDRLHNQTASPSTTVDISNLKEAQSNIAAISAASHSAANSSASNVIRAAVGETSIKAPLTEATLDNKVIHAYPLNPLETATNDIAPLIHRHSKNETSDVYDDLPPIEAFGQESTISNINSQETTDHIASSPGKLDDLLMEAIAVSATAESNEYALFDDVLSTGMSETSGDETSRKISEENIRKNESEQPIDGLSDLLAEIKCGT